MSIKIYCSCPIEEMEARPFHEGQAPVPSDAWYTDGSSRGQPAMGTAVAFQTETDRIWFDTEVVRVASGQNCELCGLWLPMEHWPRLFAQVVGQCTRGSHYGSLHGMQINGWLCIGHYGGMPCGKTYGN